jgi:hypothetical protein
MYRRPPHYQSHLCSYCIASRRSPSPVPVSSLGQPNVPSRSSSRMYRLTSLDQPHLYSYSVPCATKCDTSLGLCLSYTTSDFLRPITR